MEQTPPGGPAETQCQTEKPSQYRIGDLFVMDRKYKRDRKRFIVLAVFNGQINVIEEGKGFAQHITGPYHTFSHSTGLNYKYQNQEQVQRDYEAGFFTPYFEVL